MLPRWNQRPSSQSIGKSPGRGKMIYVIDDPPRVLVDLIYAVLRSTRGYIDPWSPRVLAASMVNLRLDLLANHVAETAPCTDHDGNWLLEISSSKILSSWLWSDDKSVSTETFWNWIQGTILTTWRDICSHLSSYP